MIITVLTLSFTIDNQARIVYLYRKASELPISGHNSSGLSFPPFLNPRPPAGVAPIDRGPIKSPGNNPLKPQQLCELKPLLKLFYCHDTAPKQNESAFYFRSERFFIKHFKTIIENALI